MWNLGAGEVNHTGDATLIRRVNESAVLEVIREHGPITRSDVAHRLHLSAPTITRIVTNLIDSGFVRECSSADSRGGRRPTLLAFNFRSSLIIGVYVQKNMVAALTDLGGEILVRRTVPSLPGEAGIRLLIGLIGELREQAAAMGIPVRGVGVGAPSIVSFKEGTVAWAPYLGWRNLPLKSTLEAALGIPVFVENEVNLIVLGERWRGAGQGRKHLVCISLGAGIGAGLLLDGQLYRGAHDAAGEVGYLVPNERYLGRVFDTFGCLEGLAGSNGIVQRTTARLAGGATSDRLSVIGQLTVEDVLDAARAGDPVAQAVVDETVDQLSLALVSLSCILDPELVVITGELADYSDLFVAPMRARLKGVSPSAPEVVASELRMDAAVLGAVAIVLRETSGAVSVQPTRA